MALILNGDTGITYPVATATGSATQASAGRVLQVVQGTYSVETTYSTSTLTDSGLTATITPSSSSNKILVQVHQNGIGKDGSNTRQQIALLRGASVLAYAVYQGGQTNTTAVNYLGSASISYLDSPSTTSATTYKTQIASGANTAQVYGQIGGGNTVSTITLMEIAA